MGVRCDTGAAYFRKYPEEKLVWNIPGREIALRIQSAHSRKIRNPEFSNPRLCDSHGLWAVVAQVSWCCRLLSGLLSPGQESRSPRRCKPPSHDADSRATPPLNGGLSSPGAEGMMPPRSKWSEMSVPVSSPGHPVAAQAATRMRCGQGIDGRPDGGGLCAHMNGISILIRVSLIELQKISAALSSTDRGCK